MAQQPQQRKQPPNAARPMPKRNIFAGSSDSLAKADEGNLANGFHGGESNLRRSPPLRGNSRKNLAAAAAAAAAAAGAEVRGTPPRAPPRQPTMSIRELAPPETTSSGFGGAVGGGGGSALDVKSVDIGVQDALSNVADADWEKKCYGLAGIRNAASTHPELLQPCVHAVLIAVDAEVKNLRSQVARAAILCVGDLLSTTALKRGLETDLDMISRTLLGKAGESNHFIRDDVDKALAAMVEHLSPPRVLAALGTNGLNHKSVVVRKSAANCIFAVVERLGPAKALKGAKDVTDRILTAAAQLVVDGSQENRFVGKKILNALMRQQPDFDKMVAKYVGQSGAAGVKAAVDHINAKGIGDPPSEGGSAKTRRPAAASIGEGSATETRRAASLPRIGSNSNGR